MTNCNKCGKHVSTPAEAALHDQQCTGVASDWHFKKGISQSVMSNEQYQKSGMSTFASVILYNARYPDGHLLIQTAKNLSNSKEHAEDVLIRGIIEQEGFLDKNGGNRLVFNLSKSPCSSSVLHPTFTAGAVKKQGCTETLIDLHNNGLTLGSKYDIEVVIFCHALYAGGGGKLTGSHEAADLLAYNGITLQTSVHQKNDGSSARKAF